MKFKVFIEYKNLKNFISPYRYRNAGREVINIIKEHCNVIERASVDEAYLDITDMVHKRMSTNLNFSDLATQLSNTFVVGYSEIGKNDEGKKEYELLSLQINK